MKKIILSMLALVVVAGGGWVGYQHFTGPQKIQAVKMVALGDSLTQGVGDPTAKQGYTGRIKKDLTNKTGVAVSMTNYGKSGDRSDQILKRLQDSPTQQKNLKKANVILMTVGGNDLMKTIKANIFISQPTQLTNQVKKSTSSYENNLQKLLKEVRKYNSQAPIFLFGNYNPLYVYFANFKSFNQSVSEYNTINKQLISQYNGYYVPTFKQLTYGQYQTASARNKLVKDAKLANAGTAGNANVVSTLTKNDTERNMYISSADHFHPNSKGYDMMTDLLMKQMLKHDQWLYAK
ncbi:SGNH/GDSL hydrolase family protein [Periweissella cryptocerci]|nr:SGNH/GDSL hydrolase family protein [Periweissella cryptocerci]